MKKIFSFLTAILFAGSMMAAEELKATLAFDGTVEWGIPTSGTNTASASFTDGTYTIQLAAANNYKQNDGYLILGKANSTLTLPAFTWKTTKLVVTGRSGASGSVKQNIYVGETAVSTETTGATGVNEYVIAADYQAAGNVYVLKVTSAHNTQIVKIEVYGEGGETISTVKTVYCKAAQAWWKEDNAAVGIYAFKGDVQNAAWPGVRMTAVEGETDLWKADIDTAMYAKIIFTRVNATGDIADWGAKTADLEIPADKDLYTITSTTAVWGDPGVAGEWSVYGEGGDTPEPPTPVEAAYYLVGTMNSWQAAEAYKFAPAEAEGEYLLHTTLAENDEIKVIKVEGETTTWYPAVGDNYIVDALHAGEKDIYFRPAGNEAWAEFGGYIWMGENQPAPVADFTQPFTLKFNGTGESGKDASGAFAADVAAIFDAASAPYVESVETATKVFAGRPIADDNSSVKFGTTSAAGSLAFTLAQAIEVDSIIVNATQYGNNAAKITVNGTEFDLTAGNKVPQDCKITPENAVSAITIAQSGSERIYLRNVRVYPKTQGGDTPVEIVLPVVKLAGSLTSWEEPVLMANAEDSLSASVTLNLGIDHYQLKVVSDGNWLSKAGDGDLYTMHRDWNHVDHLDLINTGDNIKLITDVEGAYTFTWTYADSSLVVTFPEAPAKPNYYLIGDSAFVVDAGATADKAWTPDAIPSFQDTTVLNLKAGVNYIMRLSLEGTWENHRDFRHLTDTAAGLIELPDEFGNHSIGFRLAEAGEVKIVYIAAEGENPEIFKLIGKFYIEPTPEPAKFYVTGDSALVTDAGFAGKAWNPDAIKAEADTLVLNLKAEQVYKLKVTTDGTWNTAKGFNDLTEKPEGVTTDNDENIIFSLAEAGAVQVIYIAGETPIFKIAGNFYVEPTPEPAKFYVTGDSALVTDAGFAGKAWNPDAIKAEADTLVLNLKAETDYVLKVTVNGTWEGENNVKGYNELTEKTAGLKDLSDDHNIGFRLAEAGEVKVVYIAAEGENPEIFKLIGKFYVEPTPEPAKFYVTGDSALVADAAGDATLAWNPAAIKAEADTLVLNLKAEQYYNLKVTLDGTWNTAKGFNDLTEKPAGVTMGNDENIIFSLAEAGEVKVIYIAGETPIFKIAGNFYVEPTPPTVENGFYLVGSMNDWTASAEYKFAVNPGNENEYVLQVTLDVNDELKVKKVEEGQADVWFPAEGGNYIIDDHHNGPTTIYFRPDYQGGEGWFAGCIYVIPTSTVGFENTAADTKAVKVLKNGILVIEKNNKTYNVMGQMVK